MKYRREVSTESSPFLFSSFDLVKSSRAFAFNEIGSPSGHYSKKKGTENKKKEQKQKNIVVNLVSLSSFLSASLSRIICPVLFTYRNSERPRNNKYRFSPSDPSSFRSLLDRYVHDRTSIRSR